MRALSLWQERVSNLLYRRVRGGTSGRLLSCHLREIGDATKDWSQTRFGGPRNGFGRPWPTLVMPKCGKLRAFPPCAVGHFMSNIKMFPMALLLGWPFAPKQDSRRQDSLNIDSLNKSSRVASSQCEVWSAGRRCVVTTRSGHTFSAA